MIIISVNPPSYLYKDLQPLHPVTVILEKVLQFPDVLQQVGIRGGLSQALMEQLRVLRHPGDIFH